MRYLVCLLSLVVGSLWARDVAVIEVSQDGFVRVPAESLPADALGEPNGTLALWHRGERVPLRVLDADNDGELNDGDALLFFGRRNLSPQTARSAYVLTTERSAKDPSEMLDLVRPFSPEEVITSWSAVPREVFAPLATDDLEVLDGAARPEHWCVARVPPVGGGSVLSIELPPALEMGNVTKLRMTLQGPRYAGATNSLIAQLGNDKRTDGAGWNWSGAEPYEAEFEIQSEAITDRQLSIKLTNRNRKEHKNQIGTNLDDIWVVDAIIEAPRHFQLSDGTNAPDVVRAPLAAPSKQGSGDYLVLTRSALAESLAPLVEWRRGRGLTPQVVTLDAIFDEYSGGEFEIGAIDRFLQAAAASWKPAPRFLLLAGDADHDSDRLRPGESVPAHIVEVAGNGGSASDVVYGLIDSDALPDLAIGRLPARTPEAMAAMVAKTIDYERDPNYGEWRRRISLILGEGRFGAREDSSLETMGMTLIGNYIPADFDVNVTFAKPGSPYVVTPDRFGDTVIARINEGAALLAYVGHGSPTRFDDLRWGAQRVPILDSDQVDRVESASGLPVLFIIACSTGEFDGTSRPCIAESLLARPRGPVAIVAASRVSYPYANAVFAKEIVNVFLRTREHCLGEGLNKTRALFEQKGDPLRMLIDASATNLLPDPKRMARERFDQLYLYNLLGDPALAMALPAGTVAIEAPERIQSGSQLLVSGSAQGADGATLREAAVTITLEVGRTTIHEPLESLDGLDGEALAEATMRNYRRANDKVVLWGELASPDGEFTTQFDLPADLASGKYILKVYAASPDGDASGSRAIEVGPDNSEPAVKGDEFF